MYCHSMMRTLKIGILMVLVHSLLFGCTIRNNPIPNEYAKLTLDTINISDTMVNYFNLDADNFKGDAFQAKALDIIAVPFPLENSEVTHYRLNLVIAPITEMPFEIHSILVRPVNPDVYDYFNLNDALTGYGNLNDWNFVVSNLKNFRFPLENNRFTAYQYQTTFKDRGRLMLEKYSMNSQLIEESLKELEIVIRYNHSTDIIRVSNVPIVKVQTLDDIEPGRIDILELVNTNSTSSFLAPFR
jgi:hypothetical protein